MKKRIAWLLGIAISLLALSGCGSDKTPSESGDSGVPGSGASQAVAPAERVNLADLKVEDYVTLGEYKGMELAVTPAVVEEDEWTSWCSSNTRAISRRKRGSRTAR